MENSTNHTVGSHTVRVWHGKEFVDGPDEELEGWFWAGVFPEGEGDATGPYDTEAEAEADAKDSASFWPAKE